MPGALTLPLTLEQRNDLVTMRHTHPRPYLRERAAAILQVADGQSARQVALTGLLVPRDPKTVAAWVARFATEGLAGLTMKPGRGRKPAFSPSARQHRGRPRRTGASRRARSTRV